MCLSFFLFLCNFNFNSVLILAFENYECSLMMMMMMMVMRGQCGYRNGPRYLPNVYSKHLFEYIRLFVWIHCTIFIF